MGINIFTLLQIFLLATKCHGTENESLQAEVNELKAEFLRIGQTVADFGKKIADKDKEILWLKSALEDTNEKIHEIEDKLRGTFNDNDGNYRKRQLNVEYEVAFTAKISQHLTSLGISGPIVFDSVQTNIGNHYNGTSGNFTAPVAGTYQFFATILSEPNHYIETEIIKNGGVQLAEMYSGGDSSHHGSASNYAIAQLKAGDVISVRVHGQWSSNFAIHCCFSTFSGYLLHQDFNSNVVVG